MKPSVAVAIVNWNTSVAAGAAAAAYLRSTGVDVRVTIVDNHSSAAQRRQLRESAPPAADLVWSERNRGYGRAVNSVLSTSAAAVVCASNADLLPHPDMLSRLASELAADPGIGLAAPCLGDGARRYHARLPAARDLPIRALVGRWGHRTVAEPPPGTVAAVDQPAGACLVARSATWHAVGGFDERFFLWFEDVDLAKRLLDAGHRNVVVGGARADHHGAGSFVQVDERLKQAIRLRSLTLYVAKHHPQLLLATRTTAALARLFRVRSRAVAAEARSFEVIGEDGPATAGRARHSPPASV